MRFPKPFITSLKLLLTLLLLFLVFQSVDLSGISRDLRSLNAKALVFLLAAYWAGQLLCSARWRVIAASLGMRNSYRSFVQTYFVGMFFNIGLPSLVGGDVVKAYILSKRNSRPLRAGLVSVLQDRAAGLVALLLYGTLAVLAHPIRWKGLPLWVAYFLFWAGIALVLWIALKGEKLYDRFLKPDSPKLLAKGLRTVADFHAGLTANRFSRGAVLRIALYSLLSSALVLCVFQQVTAAAGHPVGLVPFFALFPLITLVTMLPITLGGLGIREWGYVEALSLAGIPRESGLVISLATSALLLLCNLAGLLFLPSIPIDLRPQADDLSKETERA